MPVLGHRAAQMLLSRMDERQVSRLIVIPRVAVLVSPALLAELPAARPHQLRGQTGPRLD